MTTIRLRNKHDKRIRGGHPWVFSNEIDGDVSQLPPGGTVDVLDHKGAFLGRGYANPTSLIAVRILTRNKREDIDHTAFFARRFYDARAHRERLFPGRQSLRVLNAEGDWVPGLIVDRYGDTLVAQLSTLGTETRREQIREALQQVFEPTGAVLRSTGPARQREGLEDEQGPWFGDVPEHIDIDEFGVTFRVHPLGGQKTGHFFDQADNRRHAGPLCNGMRVLDVYANAGGWALHALKGGATEAVTIDKDPENAERTLVNAELNGFGGRLEAIAGEGKKTLEGMNHEGLRFDAVVLDPPAFAKTRKAAGSALRGYREINRLGLGVLRPGGLLFTSSCSYHVDEDRFVDALHQAALNAGRQLRLVRRGEQCADHPVIIGVRESRYLKSYSFTAM